MSETPIFRAPKRRKIAESDSVRRRNSDGESDEHETQEPVVKANRKIGGLKRGVQFSNAKHASQADAESESDGFAFSQMGENRTTEKLLNRFVGAGSSNQVLDVNKHMTDFVDRAMAERYRPTLQSTNSEDTQPHIDDGEQYTSTSESEEEVPDSATGGASAQRPSRPSTHHLAEVDLGPGSTSVNLARTTAALSGHLNQEEPQKKLRKRKPRLGRDGKPLKPRPRRVPDPDDLARDALIEQVLHEHGIGTYEEARKLVDTRKRGADEAADEKMAADFQQQFMDAIAERQERQQQRQNQQKEVASTNASQGPRLGGSRSARAKMAAAQALSSGANKR